VERLAEAVERLEQAVARLERALAAGPATENERLRAWKSEVAARLDDALQTIARALGGEA
jgi:predicted RecB family endonuclease